MTSSLWNLPNFITALRVIAAGPVIYLLVHGGADAFWAALAIMLLAELTDALDGFVARRYGLVSQVGKILDPLADSLYRISIFTAFAANHWMPLWMFLVIVWRDLSVSYIRVAAEQSVGTMGARQSGKWKAIVQGIAQMMTVAAHAVWGGMLPATVGMTVWLALLLATLVTAYSLFDYATSVIRRLV
ncbi:MAG: CDP-diacylglycerol--glycerol-3-phosphate 3-phosphatidyltransferase [Hyphomicrobiaceae bacterium]